ncbi:MAG: DUF1592 domain-containing protein [Rhodospirillaceae bacterium]|jgi:hypothetical protein|nr:DUF1592 domain-containing protein [Rhodospirillaceae bacterium]MBT5239938.1 DUF1592 domain-containing protein [Rhodospirillaceae bacterium]MBT5564400.1 DUF1592 domain-containing protein [Rhodospirillaceae bacterium]MBT6090037.1 DUF1592 domain-containing protein [Rhodospirillaceae bacterium]MBT6962319.1 DUF1592 domain-containing protein [Rhodospirillaceae bacterium]
MKFTSNPMSELNASGLRQGVFVAASCLMLTACGPSEPDISGAPPDMRRLTDAQYVNAITDIFGPEIKAESQADPLLRTGGLLAVGARSARITPSGFERYYAQARTVAKRVVSSENRASMFSCKPKDITAADDSCARQYFTKVGRLLYRRPLTQTEIETPTNAASEATKVSGDFYRGIAVGLAGMLTTSKFLFITDTTEPDPERLSQERLTSFAKASRLSFLLWNTTPDEALLTAAENGELDSKEGLKRQVDRLMASHRLDTGVRAFFEDFLHFDQFDTLEKDNIIYPAFTIQVAEDAREQVLRTIVDHLILREQDYRALFTTRQTFITGGLARVYRVPTKRPAEGAWIPFEFPEDDPRAGILTQVGFAALASHPGRSSPTLRGKAVRESILCQQVPDPPGDVDFSLFEDPNSPNKTARERLTVHRTAPACAGCHKITDPIGLALENLDGVGQLRTTENGAPIDASGDLDGTPFTDAAGLGRAVSTNPATTSCVTQRLASYALGRSAGPAEREYVKYLEQGFADDGYSIPALLRRIAYSDALFTVSTPTVDNVTRQSKADDATQEELQEKRS